MADHSSAGRNAHVRRHGATSSRCLAARRLGRSRRERSRAMRRVAVLPSSGLEPLGPFRQAPPMAWGSATDVLSMFELLGILLVPTMRPNS
jgi:hypothetical protein